MRSKKPLCRPSRLRHAGEHEIPVSIASMVPGTDVVPFQDVDQSPGRNDAVARRCPPDVGDADRIAAVSQRLQDCFQHLFPDRRSGQLMTVLDWYSEIDAQAVLEAVGGRLGTQMVEEDCRIAR